MYPRERDKPRRLVPLSIRFFSFLASKSRKVLLSGTLRGQKIVFFSAISRQIRYGRIRAYISARVAHTAALEPGGMSIFLKNHDFRSDTVVLAPPNGEKSRFSERLGAPSRSSSVFLESARTHPRGDLKLRRLVLVVCRSFEIIMFLGPGAVIWAPLPYGSEIRRFRRPAERQAGVRHPPPHRAHRLQRWQRKTRGRGALRGLGDHGMCRHKRPKMTLLIHI